MNIYEILKKFREESFSESEKGTKFERLIKNWFLTASIYSGKIKNVYMWNEFPYRDQLGLHDVGIDLVAETYDNEYWAIQCKCYKESSSIQKHHVDTFISTLNRKFYITNVEFSFSNALWVQTNSVDKWSSNALESIKNQSIPVQIIDIETLSNSDVNWEKILNGLSGSDARSTKKHPLEHQVIALQKAHEYFVDKNQERGKLIMACGTGKTYTSLKIVEDILQDKGLVLFMVPSIALLNQSINAWKSDATTDFEAICICSDNKAQQKIGIDPTSAGVEDLAVPACTNSESIKRQLLASKNKGKMIVVFSTYQSIDAVSSAQSTILRETDGKFGTFDFVVCDEAHRTTGIKLSDSKEDESYFIKIHSNENIQAKKRLYMTATPRLYGEDAKNKASLNNCVLCSMDDPAIYGEEFYRVGFSYAVEHNLLTDYKVLVLTVSNEDLPENIRAQVENKSKVELDSDDTLKLIGVLNGLSKKITKILPEICKLYAKNLTDEDRANFVSVQASHIDGSMNSSKRSELLSQLKEEIDEPNQCKILCNVRCLSEGVDVPALDAVIFLSPKNSKVDVVQSVGRVMRNFKRGEPDEKKYGYIIIPVICPSNVSPEELLNDNQRFKVVWDILNALRSHDESFNAEVQSINLNKKDSSKVIIAPPANIPGKGKTGLGGNNKDGEDENDNGMILDGDYIGHQLELRFDGLKDAIYARLVEKCGDRLYWENWAKDVGIVAQNFIERISKMVATEGPHKERFDEFVIGLKRNLNPSVSEGQAIEMLAQHMITKPVFDALFKEYNFVENNPVSKSMQIMIEFLENKGLKKDTAKLEEFYASVRRNVGKIDNLQGKQHIIKTLYEKFFKTAFPKTVDQLGIVYTPIECVDFMIHSVNDILNQEFKRSISDENVHILDPFTGTGTFITRLLQSGLIQQKDFERKYKKEIHCNELVLLAYYVADINIETVFHEITQRKDYLPYDGICLTDTFELNEHGDHDIFSKVLPANSERAIRQKKTPVKVIIGNPPYSVGQGSANDNAQNLHYEELEEKLKKTYVENSTAGLSKSTYDSYIKAFRWASDRIENYDDNLSHKLPNKDGGIIAFISNGGWLDGNAQDGMRKCLVEEFSSIYVLNLRGNCRTQGEQRRKEGEGIFDIGSRTPVTITFLIKNPKKVNKPATIYYHDIGDYLKREDKLNKLNEFKSLTNVSWQVLKPNEKFDWINQRDGLFDTLVSLGPKKKFTEDKCFFRTYSLGCATARDSWVYNFSIQKLNNNIQNTISYYQSELQNKINDCNYIFNRNKTKAVFTRDWENFFKKNIEITEENEYRVSMYRPYVKTNFYFADSLNQERYQLPKLFPTSDSKNLVICVSGSTKGFTSIISDIVPDLHYVGDSQCFPLYYYEYVKQDGDFGDISENKGEEVLTRKDAITDWILKEFRTRLKAKSITREQIFYYVYGILHSPDYRNRFELDLKKALPRLPIVETIDDFLKFSEAGKALANLHLNYETVAPYSDAKVDYIHQPDEEDAKAYEVVKMKFPKKGEKGTIIYNGNITITNIPAKAYEYIVNGKSAIEWIMERYQITVDKESLIQNDPNDWAREHNQPKYILNLLLSIINVSVQSVDIVSALPKLKGLEHVIN